MDLSYQTSKNGEFEYLQGLVHLYYYKNQITVHTQGTRLASVVLTLLAPSTLSVLSRYVCVEGGSNF